MSASPKPTSREPPTPKIPPAGAPLFFEDPPSGPAASPRRRPLGPAPAEGKMRGLRLSGTDEPRQYLLLARAKGVLYALDDWCNHAGCLLSEGMLDGDSVICPCHRVAFGFRDGRVVTEPRICADQAVYAIVQARALALGVAQTAPGQAKDFIWVVKSVRETKLEEETA